MNPTDEQAEAIRLFLTGGSLAIEAGAGTGKTTTLVQLARQAPTRRGQYVAFNKALVEDSRPKFPGSMAVHTAHALAFRELGKDYQHRLNGPTVYAKELAQRLHIDPIFTQDWQGIRKRLAPGFLAGRVKDGIASFCRSADGLMTDKHMPIIPALDRPGSVPVNAIEVRKDILPYAKMLWNDLQQHQGWGQFQHDHYLKMWQLTEPRIPADYILFDEAQDANPVIADIVAQQAKHGVQLVYVGDSQQEIYAWTGAVNALSKVEVDHRSFLTQSFRFGPAIAEVANAILDQIPGAAIRLTGTEGIGSTVERVDLPKAILTRTNAVGLQRLLELQEMGRTATLVGGAKELLSFVQGVEDLQLNGWTSHPELSSFSSWEDVRLYVEQDENGDAGDLYLFVRLIDSFGIDAMKNALRTMVPEDRAEVVISTAHKSKGREWDTVQLAADFNSRNVSPAALRLLYVAATRAKQVLDPFAVELITETL